MSLLKILSGFVILRLKFKKVEKSVSISHVSLQRKLKRGERLSEEVIAKRMLTMKIKEA